MGKKNPPKNGFYYFFTELKAKQKQPMSNNQAVELAGPMWQKMSAEQRKPYEDKCRLEKRNRDKQTCTGELVLEIQKREKEAARKQASVRSDIERMVKLAKSDGSLPEHVFYVIHMNYFFYREGEDKYYPAEVALGKFTLKNGINKDDVYHSNVYPGQFPLGFKRAAMERSDESHKLDVDFGNRNNLREVWEHLVEYNMENEPLFVLESEAFVVEKMLQDVSAEYDLNYDFRIYSLDYLFYILKNEVHDGDVAAFPATTYGTIIFETDIYQMVEDIACQYHQLMERQAHCSKSMIIRWVYTICDNCTADLGLGLIPGRHVPSNADIRKKIEEETLSLSKLSISKQSTPMPSSAALTATVRTAPHPRPTPRSRLLDRDSDSEGCAGFVTPSEGQTADDEEDESAGGGGGGDRWETAARKRSARLRRNDGGAGDDDGAGSSANLSGPSTQQSCGSDPAAGLGFVPSRRPQSVSICAMRGRGRGLLHRKN